MKLSSLLTMAALLAAGSWTASAQNQLPVNFLGLTALEVGPQGLSGGPDDDLFTLNHHARTANANVANSVAMTASSTATLPAPRTQRVERAERGTSGFPGLTHFDQRFAGTGVYQNTQFSLEPPDQALCAGNGFVVEAINNALAVYTDDGTRVAGPEALSQFYKLRPEIIRATPAVFGQFISDPKCYYDAATRRWFVTELEIDTDPATGADANHSSVLIAVSKTSDPTGSYFLYSFDTSDGTGTDPLHPQCPCFGDQPLIGADAFGFYVSTNEFSIHGASFNGAQIYALSKDKLEAGTLGTVVHIDAGAIPTPPADQAAGSKWFSVQPASSSNPFGFFFEGSGTEYFLSALQFGSTPFDNRIAVWALTNTASLDFGTPNLQLLHTVISSESYGQVNAFAASQKIGPTPLRDALGDTDAIDLLNANDDRMNQVVFANGKLWSGVNTNVSVGGQTRQGIAWFSVAPELEDGKLSAHVRDQGYVAVAGEDVLFPSIAVGWTGQAVMTFTLSGPDFFPSTAYTRIGDEEEAGNVHVIGAGVGPDDGFTGYAAFGGNGVARWGDYTAAVADEWGNVWMSTEYIGQRCTLAAFTADTTCGGTRSMLANWGTFIGKVPPRF
jgi:hypothetical protein